jgi:hypothetical protein
MVAFHWYSSLLTTVILVRVAAVVFALQSPAGPQVTLPAVPPVLSVAQLIVIDDWIESVRYGYRVSMMLVSATAENRCEAEANKRHNRE